MAYYSSGSACSQLNMLLKFKNIKSHVMFHNVFVSSFPPNTDKGQRVHLIPNLQSFGIKSLLADLNPSTQHYPE